MNRSLPWTGVLAALATALIGSGWQIASRHGVTTSLGPLELAVLRYAIPALVLLPVAWASRAVLCSLPARQGLLLVLGGGLPFGLVVMAGAQWAPAAHMGVFVAGSVPLFTALGGWWLDGERPARSRCLGLALMAAGLAVSGLGGLAAAASAWRGDLLFLLAALLWSGYTLALRRSGLTAWQGAAAINLGSTLLLLPLLWFAGAPKLLSAPLREVALQAVGQGLFAGLLGLALYGLAVARLGAARASLSGALVPLMTAVGAAWLLREPLTASTWIALALVLPGVALAGGAWATRTASLRFRTTSSP
ncbi:DMT family transporter [Variovorax sp.]|jgi:drug/metabolite transporter (DMT)-like permease|uniref:DMT family transporter n=2 Tax=Variovorax sp. TaxID=1871043 RepID=UPI00122757C9|nr:DMT family transporter [Variovorax sp.]TAJ56433.1 MAG: DMT family transporter [Variovorax sp.]